MQNIFRDLEDPAAFSAFVGDYFNSTPAELGEFVDCTLSIDASRLAYAHTEYTQNIGKFAIYLHSKDPDHYKRAGALLHALYLSKPIVAVNFHPALEEVDALSTPLGVTYADVDKELTFGCFYRDYHNEFTSFALCYDICRQYEDHPRDISQDYLRTVCTYLYNNRSLSVESLFMLFKSLMQ